MGSILIFPFVFSNAVETSWVKVDGTELQTKRIGGKLRVNKVVKQGNAKAGAVD